MQNITLTSPCLTNFSSWVLENKENYLKDSLGSFAEDIIPENENWNVPHNYSLFAFSDQKTFELENLLQNETEALVKLITFYEEGDFIGWHTNSAVSGYNLILTYSESEDSYFETQEGKIYDTLGWSYKVHEFGEQLFWHRAVAHGNRITISLLFASEADRDAAIAALPNLTLDT